MTICCLQLQDPTAMQAASHASEALLEDGYCLLHAAQLPWVPPLAQLRNGIEALKAAGWHASFIFMFDEAWALMHAARHMMQQGVCGE